MRANMGGAVLIITHWEGRRGQIDRARGGAVLIITRMDREPRKQALDTLHRFDIMYVQMLQVDNIVFKHDKAWRQARRQTRAGDYYGLQG
jgi:hypothetical protein